MDRERTESAEQAAAGGGDPAPPPPTPKAGWSRRRRVTLAALLAASPLLLTLLLFAVDRAPRAGEVLRGVSAGGVELAGLSRADAERAITELGQKLVAEPLRVRVRAQSKELKPEQIGFRVDAQKTVDEALAAGRSGSLIEQLGFWIARLRTPIELPLVTSIDAPSIEPFLAAWEKEAIDDPAFEGAVVVRGEAPEPDYPRQGHRIDRAAAPRLLEEAFAHERRGDVDLPLTQSSPRLDRAAVDSAVERARGLLAGPVILVPPDAVAPAPSEGAAPSEAGAKDAKKPQDKKSAPGSSDPAAADSEGEIDRRVHFAPKDLARALKSRVREGDPPAIDLSFDPAAFTEKLAPVRARLEHPPRDAALTVDDRDRITIVPSRSGARLDLGHIADALLTAASSPSREGPFPVDEGDPPEFSTEAATALRITHLVSQATTRHPCCQARVKNIHRIADLIDGRIVRPGETLSVNAAVGERTAANGFVMAPGIEDGEMVDTMGGGVSQFATTFFNAMFHGGYDIIERQPHSFYFSRYPMGHEATLSWPKPDLVIRNDTEAGILIKALYTKTSITVKLYGDNGGRKVQAKVSRRLDIVEPPVEYIPNEKLPPEKEKVKESGSVGWSVIVARILTFPDGTKKEERRKVTYKPRVRRVQVHPCRIPEGEPGHTGEPCPKPEEEEEGKEGEATPSEPAPAPPAGANPF